MSMTEEEHLQRHRQLHQHLDELLGDWLYHGGGAERDDEGRMATKRPLSDLMEWSYRQTIKADHASTFEGRSSVEEIESKVDYQAWALSMCTLLDVIGLAVNEDDFDRVSTLVSGRFSMAERYGLKVEFTGMPVSGHIQ